MSNNKIKPSLQNPLAEKQHVDFNIPGEIAGKAGAYEEVMREGYELIERPIKLNARSNQSASRRSKSSTSKNA